MSSSDYAEAMVRAGASAYILKQGAVEELCAAIRRVSESRHWQEWEAVNGESSHSLLFIDDDAVFLKTISEALHDKHSNLSIATATSAEQGLRLLTLRQFDAVISDFRMVGLNGVDLLKECQADYAGTPVVLITGYGTSALEQDALDQGAYAILQKPVDVEQLYDVVTRSIRRSQWLQRPDPDDMPLEELQLHEFAQQSKELSRKLDRLLQDTRKGNDASQQC